MIVERFWSELADADKAALLLDYDGTLAPFRVERDKAVPYPGVRERLTEIRKNTETRLVIISGRAIDDLLPLLALTPPPEIWGCHGWERLDADGHRPEVVLPLQAQQGLDKARQWVTEQGLAEFVESKPVSVALHWRGCAPDQVKSLHEEILSGWQPLAIEYQLEIHSFNGGLELRCPGRDKGTAIDTVLRGLAPDTPVAFLGDDLTDEDGFKTIKGLGLGVLVSSELRQTCADVQIKPPLELLAFLDKWHTNAPRKN